MSSAVAARSVLLVLLLAGLAAGEGAGPADRHARYTARHRRPERPLRVVLASYLGGVGHEWLTGAGVRSDGRVVVVGNCLGPALAPRLDLPVAVLGEDAPDPPPLDQSYPQPPFDHATGRVPLDWRHVNGTAFVALVEPVNGTVERLVRLPWRSGAPVGAVVGEDDAIYIAGTLGATGFPGARAVDHGRPVPDKRGGFTTGGHWSSGDGNTVKRNFLLKLPPDLSTVAWCRTFETYGRGTELRFGPAGQLQVLNTPLLVFATDGELVAAHDVAFGGKEWVHAYHPGSFAEVVTRYTLHLVGGMHGFWCGSGNAPWFPVPDGETRGTPRLYGWGRDLAYGDPLFPLHRCHVALPWVDNAGKLYLLAAKSGPASPLDRDPRDPTRHHGLAGLGWDVSGVPQPPLVRGMAPMKGGYTMQNMVRNYHASPIMQLVRLDFAGRRPEAATAFCGFDPETGAVRAARGSDLHVAADGSLLVYGRCEGGLVQTEGGVAPGPGAAPFLAAFGPGLESLRCSTRLPGTGAVVRNFRPACGIMSRAAMASRVVDGRLRAVLVTAAGPPAREATTANAPQPEYGRGRWDGFLVVLDGPVAPADASPTAAPADAIAAQPACPWPAVGARLQLGGGLPRFVNGLMVLRDGTGACAPSVLAADVPEAATWTWDPGRLDLEFVAADRGLAMRDAPDQLLAPLVERTGSGRGHRVHAPAVGLALHVAAAIDPETHAVPATVTLTVGGTSWEGPATVTLAPIRSVARPRRPLHEVLAEIEAWEREREAEQPADGLLGELGELAAPPADDEEPPRPRPRHRAEAVDTLRLRVRVPLAAGDLGLPDPDRSVQVEGVFYAYPAPEEN